MSENYGIDSIQHWETREAFRNRIQVQLGSDDVNGIYQAFKEIINNSTDEAIAGYGNKIHILVDEEQNNITVRDYGRGVPFGIKNGKNILVSIFTEANTGGKFDKNAYKNSSGLNGVGGTAVCMSSEYFFVTSIRDGKVANAEFEKGLLKSYTEVSYEEYGEVDGTGTIVGFRPDPEVFKKCDEHFSYERICQEIKNISYFQ